MRSLPTSINLSPTAKDLIRQFRERHGLKQSAAIEMAIRHLAVVMLPHTEPPSDAPSSDEGKERSGM